MLNVYPFIPLNQNQLHLWSIVTIGILVLVILALCFVRFRLHRDLSLAKGGEVCRSEENLNQKGSCRGDRDRFLLSILAAAPVGIGVTRDRVLVWVSANLLKILGYKAAELIGKSARILYESDEEFERVGRIKYRDIALFGSGSIETRWLKKDGEGLDILLSSALIDVTNPAAGTTFTVIDITASKQAKASLQKALHDAREARAQVEIILRSVADGLIFTDTDNRVVLMSDSAEVMFGRKTQDVYLQPVHSALGNELLTRQLSKVSQEGCPEATVEIELAPLSDGGGRFVQARSAAVMGREDAMHGVITLLRDVSRERALDRLKSEFIATAAHELRTPLTAVMGFSELLLTQDDFTPEQKKEYLSIIFHKAEILGKIIDDMLELARLDTGQSIITDRKKVDIDKLIADTIADYRNRFPGYYFDYACSSGSIGVLVDDRKMQCVLENLLDNAVNFSAEGSRIEVSCDKTPEGLCISVEDQGIGMTPEQSEQVFDRFYRADASNTAKKGLGLGLTMVKSIMDAHQGQIRIHSEKGRGTKITLTLSLAEPAKIPTLCP